MGRLAGCVVTPISKGGQATTVVNISIPSESLIAAVESIKFADRVKFYEHDRLQKCIFLMYCNFSISWFFHKVFRKK